MPALTRTPLPTYPLFKNARTDTHAMPSIAPAPTSTSSTLRPRPTERQLKPVDPHVTPALKKRGQRTRVFGYTLSDEDCFTLARSLGIRSNIMLGVILRLQVKLRIPNYLADHVEDPTTGQWERFIGIASNVDEEHLNRATDPKWLEKINGLLAPILADSDRKPLWYRTVPY